MVTFRIAGLPTQAPVRNPDTGLIENGYRLVVVDSTTGARATLEIPQSQFNEQTIQAQADYYLGQQNAVLAKYGPKPPAAAQ